MMSPTMSPLRSKAPALSPLRSKAPALVIFNPLALARELETLVREVNKTKPAEGKMQGHNFWSVRSLGHNFWSIRNLALLLLWWINLRPIGTVKRTLFTRRLPKCRPPSRRLPTWRLPKCRPPTHRLPTRRSSRRSPIPLVVTARCKVLTISSVANQMRIMMGSKTTWLNLRLKEGEDQRVFPHSTWETFSTPTVRVLL